MMSTEAFEHQTLPDATLVAFGSTAQSLFSEASLVGTVGLVTTTAGRFYRSDDAGVLLKGPGGAPGSVGGTPGSDAVRADTLQVRHHQGPGLQSIELRQPVLVTDLRSDSRWRCWAPLAAALGLRSALSVPLADGDPVGALTLYSRTISQFVSRDLASAVAFAQLASVAIAVAQERQQLMQAITSRAVVGQAQGILMARHGVTAAQAFTVLHRYSSHSNRKLRTIAEAVIRDRDLPEIQRTEARQASSS